MARPRWLRLTTGPTEDAQRSDLLESSAELCRAFRAGDPDAFRTVFRAYVDDVARTIRAGVVVHVESGPLRVGSSLDEHDVENLIQETFARAFREEARLAYDGVRPYGPYLSTIARNLVIDLGRAKKRESAVVAPVDLDRAAEMSGEGEAVTEVLETDELRAIVDRFLAGRTAEERRVFAARYDDGLALRGAAHALGMPLFRLRRIDIALRRDLLRALREGGFLLDREVSIGETALIRAAPHTGGREARRDDRASPPQDGDSPAGDSPAGHAPDGGDQEDPA